MKFNELYKNLLKEDSEALERAKGILTISNVRELRKALKLMYEDLEEEGFEHYESIKILQSLLNSYLEDIDIPFGVLDSEDDIV